MSDNGDAWALLALAVTVTEQGDDAEGMAQNLHLAVNPPQEAPQEAPEPGCDGLTRANRILAAVIERRVFVTRNQFEIFFNCTQEQSQWRRRRPRRGSARPPGPPSPRQSCSRPPTRTVSVFYCAHSTAHDAAAGLGTPSCC